MEKNFIVEMDGQYYGPYSLSDIRKFGVFSDTMVSYADTNDFRPAIEYAEIKDYVADLTTVGKQLDLGSLHYYYKEEDQMYGPYSIVEMAYLDLKENSLVSVDGCKTFVQAKEIEGLLELVNSLLASGVTITPQPVAPQPVLPTTPAPTPTPTPTPVVFTPVVQNSDLGRDDLKKTIKEQEGEMMALEENINYVVEFGVMLQKAETIISDINFLPNKSQLSNTKNAEQVYSHYLQSMSRIESNLDKLVRLGDEIDKKYSNVRQVEAIKPENINQVDTQYITFVNRIGQINDILSQVVTSYSSVLPERNASSVIPISTKEKPVAPKTVDPLTYMGIKTQKYKISGQSVMLRYPVYEQFFNNKHMVLMYDQNTKPQCEEIVNTIVTNAYATCTPELLKVCVCDMYESDGTSQSMKVLPSQIFSLAADQNQTNDMFQQVISRIQQVVNNILPQSITPVTTLKEYNDTHDGKETNYLIVVDCFPMDLANNIVDINRILRTGLPAGVQMIVMVDKSSLTSDDNMRLYQSVDWQQLKQRNILEEYDLTTSNGKQMIDFNTRPLAEISNIVAQIRKNLELQNTKKIVPMQDYIEPQENWWKMPIDKRIDIPMGICKNGSPLSFHFTQENGQNAAAVIGLPGSGKSVALHSIILSAAMRYSPKLLNMYLIDFSGVEFDIYAKYQLPHARVVAPEAEREFGISILREIEEEAARRQDKCRQIGVSDLVGLQTKCPEENWPSLLLVVDEFQKFFEIENDEISREAERLVRTIIKEYRKFGIYLILATQELLSNNLLPLELMANRIVFNSKPGDFDKMVEWPYQRAELKVFEFIYNDQTGLAAHNMEAKTFCAEPPTKMEILEKLRNMKDKVGYAKTNMLVFRSKELPNFRDRILSPEHRTLRSNPESVGLYLGESIAIDSCHVCACLERASCNNLLVVGGDNKIGAQIAMYATLSAMDQHKDHSAIFYSMNYSGLNDALESMDSHEPFTIKIGKKEQEVVSLLQEIQDEITRRKDLSGDAEYPNIYLSIYSIQQARAFEAIIDGWNSNAAAAGKLLQSILIEGSRYGVHVILQVDTLNNYKSVAICDINAFRHRVLLQMSETDAQCFYVPAANLLVGNGNVIRAIYSNQQTSISVKFKPYK